MEKKQHLKLEQNYLIASAAAIFAAFLCINMYPEHHGEPQIGRSGLLALSAAMIAMIIFIVKKALSEHHSKKSDAPDHTDSPASDPGRLKKMFFLWSAFTVLLSASLVRYPLYYYIKENAPFDTKGAISMTTGIGLIIATIGHVILRRNDYRKL